MRGWAVVFVVREKGHQGRVRRLFSRGQGDPQGGVSFHCNQEDCDKLSSGQAFAESPPGLPRELF